MKLISLNIWGGKLYEPLMEFISKTREDTDIFCFQELFFGDRPGKDVNGARANIAKEIEGALPEFNIYPYLAPKESSFIGKRTLSPIGQAIFSRKSLSVTDKGGFYTHLPVINHSGIFQYIKVINGKDKFIIGNLHGLWLPTGKLDNPERIKQSEMIINLYNSYGGKMIICGDFNLRPETESIAIFDKNFKNLIRDFGIKSTRSSFYKDAEKYKDFISDYAFVSQDINIMNFKAIDISVSDHLPIMVEFS
ncbi:MAG: hypothetical protein HYT62_00115 [Candidatus Yanofskybacteria bacterium]|nr:hypothetical protein [Candidatus Yanofskybacteria bacterium]